LDQEILIMSLMSVHRAVSQKRKRLPKNMWMTYMTKYQKTLMIMKTMRKPNNNRQKNYLNYPVL
jgi:hypothetical protein